MTDQKDKKTMPDRRVYNVDDSKEAFTYDQADQLGFKRKRVLLHSCCGPCSTASIERLLKEYDVTVFFYNPNISTLEEYNKRLEAQLIVLSYFTEEANLPGRLDFELGPYDKDRFIERAAELADQPEGGKRCSLCFEMRLEETAKRARTGNFDYFTTTLSISPHKDFDLIKAIGDEMAERYDVAFLPENFKKKDGFKRSIELSKQLGIYRQNFCGCMYSER